MIKYLCSVIAFFSFSLYASSSSSLASAASQGRSIYSPQISAMQSTPPFSYRPAEVQNQQQTKSVQQHTSRAPTSAPINQKQEGLLTTKQAIEDHTDRLNRHTHRFKEMNGILIAQEQKNKASDVRLHNIEEEVKKGQRQGEGFNVRLRDVESGMKKQLDQQANQIAQQANQMKAMQQQLDQQTSLIVMLEKSHGLTVNGQNIAQSDFDSESDSENESDQSTKKSGSCCRRAAPCLCVTAGGAALLGAIAARFFPSQR